MMPSPLFIPKLFRTDDPAALKEDLGRFAESLDAYVRNIPNVLAPIPVLTNQATGKLSFGQVVRAAPVGGQSLVFLLPPPDPVNIGKRCGIRRSGVTGEILVYASGCLVAGQTNFRLRNDVHLAEFLFDGDYYPTCSGAGYA